MGAGHFSVGMTWLVADHCYYLLDVYREKGSFEKTKQAIIALANRHAPTKILVESNGAGEAMISELASELLPVEGIFSKLSKECRAQPCTAQIERGEVYLPEQAVWKEAFVEECRAFPKGKHDDQVDSLTLLLNAVREYAVSARQSNRLIDQLTELNEERMVKEQLERTRYRSGGQDNWLLQALDKKYPGWAG